MTQHPRHTAPKPGSEPARGQAKSHQGTYGSGGSYGAGGGFKDDEPGSRVDEGDGAPSGEDAAQRNSPVQDVHTRVAEENDEYLREVRRTDQQRNAAKGKHGSQR